MKRTPISKLEKFVDGLNKLLVAQPAATISIEDNKFFVGDLKDTFISKGLTAYIVNAGFVIEEDRFVFKTKEEEKDGKFKNQGSNQKEAGYQRGGKPREVPVHPSQSVRRDPIGRA